MRRSSTIVGACLALLLAMSGCSSAKTRHSGSSSSAPSTTRALPVVTVTPASWKLPAPRTRAAATLEGSSIVVLGGQNASRMSIAEVVRIDPNSGAVTKGAPLAAKLHDAAGATLTGPPGSRIAPQTFFLGGGDATETANVEAVPASGAPRVVGTLPHPNADLGAASDGTTLYAVGGYDGKAVLTDVLRSTDGVNWTAFASLMNGVRYPAVTIAEGALWIFGGSANDVATAIVQRIDLATGAVAQAGTLPAALSASAAATVNGVIVLAGGRVNDKAVAGIWTYNPANNTTTEVGSLPSPVSNHVMVAVGDTAYVIGGEANKVPTADVTALRVS